MVKEKDVIPSVCQYHDDMVARTESDHTAIEGKVAKSSIKWLAMVFALPVIGAILFVYSFMSTADYRYGAAQTAWNNAANIKMLDERTLSLKNDILKVQNDIYSDVSEIKKELKNINRELMKRYSGSKNNPNDD